MHKHLAFVLTISRVRCILLFDIHAYLGAAVASDTCTSLLGVHVPHSNRGVVLFCYRKHVRYIAGTVWHLNHLKYLMNTFKYH